jgi:hypothetical protein
MAAMFILFPYGVPAVSGFIRATALDIPERIRGIWLDQARAYAEFIKAVRDLLDGAGMSDIRLEGFQCRWENERK